IGCGTGRDVARLLARAAAVYAGDLSREMLAIGQDRLMQSAADLSRVRLFQADATRLPFRDEFFDAAYHFGGLNLFPDIPKAVAEVAGVVKRGGRVVAGDEGIGQWLADTDFARILENSNPLFRHRAPVDKLPVNARNVACHWILSGSFYVISFDVGTGEPQL